MRVGPLDRAELAAAARLLTTACRFDRADVVAEEKLFGDGPTAASRAFGAWDGDQLVGAAAICARYLRILAVTPDARGRGVGSALLDACERAARDAGEPRLRALDQPGNYLAPGIDERNVDTIAWLEKRGWHRDGEPRSNVLIAVRDNPRVTIERAEALAAAARARGYEIRRARQPEPELLDAVRAEFGNAWPFEVARALGLRDGEQGHLVDGTPDVRVAGGGALAAARGTSRGHVEPSLHRTSRPSVEPSSSQLHGTSRPSVEPSSSQLHGTPGVEPSVEPPRATGTHLEPRIEPSAATSQFHGSSGVHVALLDGNYCAFAAHDGNNRGLGWFGPTGTWPAHRGKGLGEALLLACLVDVAAEHPRCEIAWIGPRPFYEKAAGIVEDRRFVAILKDLSC